MNADQTLKLARRFIELSPDKRRLFLKAPQSIVADGKGGYLLAEGGRNRVLQLTPPAEHSTAQR